MACKYGYEWCPDDSDLADISMCRSCIRDMKKEIERLRGENSCMRLESKYLVDLDDGLPLVLDFDRIANDLDENERLREWIKEPRAWAESDLARVGKPDYTMLTERIRQCTAALEPEGNET